MRCLAGQRKGENGRVLRGHDRINIIEGWEGMRSRAKP